MEMGHTEKNVLAGGADRHLYIVEREGNRAEVAMNADGRNERSRLVGRTVPKSLRFLLVHR